MEEMKYDMSGAAGVLGAMQGIAELGIEANDVVRDSAAWDGIVDVSLAVDDGRCLPVRSAQVKAYAVPRQMTAKSSSSFASAAAPS